MRSWRCMIDCRVTVLSFGRIGKGKAPFSLLALITAWISFISYDFVHAQSTPSSAYLSVDIDCRRLSSAPGDTSTSSAASVNTNITLITNDDFTNFANSILLVYRNTSSSPLIFIPITPPSPHNHLISPPRLLRPTNLSTKIPIATTNPPNNPPPRHHSLPPNNLPNSLFNLNPPIQFTLSPTLPSILLQSLHNSRTITAHPLYSLDCSSKSPSPKKSSQKRRFPQDFHILMFEFGVYGSPDGIWNLYE